MTPTAQPHLLVVDDEPRALEALQAALLLKGYDRVTCMADSRKVQAFLRKQTADVMLLDLDMPQVSGQEILDLCAEICPQMPVIVVTASSDIATAVHCVKAGAFDYLVKPIDIERLVTSVNRALEMSDLRRENLALSRCLDTGSLANPEAFAAILTCSQAMLKVMGHAESVAPSMHPVLLLGETGVGKELLARAIHGAGKKSGRFVAVNAAGMDDHVFADTLFGHERGAFTGADHARAGLIEEASEGTLLLDEIGDLSMTSQIKLLRLLQDGEYFPLGADRPRHAAARFVFATNSNLERLLADGRFRKDLYYRLRIHEIRVPALRDHPEDIPLLTAHFIGEACRELQKPVIKAKPELLALLNGYDFPGNVRELKGLLTDAVGRSRSSQALIAFVRERIVPKAKTVDASISLNTPSAGENIVFPDPMPTLAEIDQAAFAEALRRAEGNQAKTARLLGISQPAVSKRLRQLPRPVPALPLRLPRPSGPEV
ncbi:MAG: sigma-54 dependent transcriptional regulator [Verrucomicrobiota bacterium]